MKKLLAELFGTFTLVFAGTGAIVVNDLSGGSISHVGIALTFGLVVLAMIYTVGDISGAHLNPAVTLVFLSRAASRGGLFCLTSPASFAVPSPPACFCDCYSQPTRRLEPLCPLAPRRSRSCWSSF